MSTISAGTTSNTALVHTADTTGNLVLQSSGVTQATISSTGFSTPNAVNVPNTFGFKNRLINGAMVIDQRNAGASVSATSGGQYFLDRWCASLSASGKFTVQQNAGAVAKPTGFANYLGVTSSTAWAVGASDYATLNQFIEGFNVADLQWGTSSAAAVTLSFVVYSSLTGTFGGVIHNGINAGGQTRTYPFTFTVSAANTWTTISLPINGDTTGTWGSSNGAGISVCFSLAAGSSKVATSGAWTGVAAYSGATGQTNILATNAATFYVTGVQFEKGSVATSFDVRPYGTELVLCQRYYESSFDIGVAPANGSSASVFASDNGVWFGYCHNSYTSGSIPFQVSKRTAPTIAFYGNNTAQWKVNNTFAANARVAANIGTNESGIFQQNTAGYVTIAGHWDAAAEL
jgi:hypothetical protein